jgi:hypothetical protein
MIRGFHAFSGLNPSCYTPRSQWEHNQVPHPPATDATISSNRSAIEVPMMSP